LSRIPDPRRGQASGLLQTLRQLGGTLGLALIGTLFAGVERAGIHRMVQAQGGAAADRSRLSGLLLDAAEGQAAALNELATSWPKLVPELKATTTQGISAGFTLSTGVMLLALLVAVFVMRSGRQTRDG